MKDIQKTENIWSVVCKRVIVDEQTKLMSLIDIVEKLILDIDIEKAPQEIRDSFKEGRFEKPIQIQDSMTVASYWNIEKQYRGATLEVETIIRDQEDQKLASGILPLEIGKENTNHRTIFTLPSLPVTGSGIYKIESVLKDREGEVITQAQTQIRIDLKIVVGKNDI
jgi:hypothetical protein